MSKKEVDFSNRDRFIELGLMIASLRKMQGMSQEKLAEKAKISRSHLSSIEAPNIVFCPLCRLTAVEVMVDLGGVVILNRGRGVVQHRQQVLLHVPHLGGVLPEAVEHEADVFAVQLQQPGLHHSLGEVVPRHSEVFLFGADRLHH